MEIVALIVTRIILTIFSPAENKDELSPLLRVSISLPCFQYASIQTVHSVLMVSEFKSGTDGTLLLQSVNQFLLETLLSDFGTVVGHFGN